MAWPLPVNDTILGFPSWVTWVNEVTRDTFGIMIALTLWIVIFIALKGQHDTRTAFMTTAYLNLVIDGALWAAGIVSTGTVVLATILFAFIMLGAYWMRES